MGLKEAATPNVCNKCGSRVIWAELSPGAPVAFDVKTKVFRLYNDVSSDTGVYAKRAQGLMVLHQCEKAS